jgi:outer membrane protein assembly factor BamE (lipoprotein component of BamABCDE complex)
MRCARALAAALVMALAPGCTIVRSYVGNELPPLTDAQLVPGRTTKADVLRELGPPDRLVRQYEGEVFVYAYIRRNLSSFDLSEPVFTRLRVFSYTKTQEKSDRMVVLFDRAGVLTAVGFRRGTEQLDRF